jgi:hypothetical protein
MGVPRDGTSVQEIGSISTKENRCIVFPNIFQHQVQPFFLKDEAKPGYRKILVFFLCDPNYEHIISTKNVAPQQPEEHANVIELLRRGPVGQLPEDLFQLIVSELPPPISRSEAERYRLNLMDERASFNKDSSKVKGIEYSLCEH